LLVLMMLVLVLLGLVKVLMMVILLLKGMMLGLGLMMYRWLPSLSTVYCQCMKQGTFCSKFTGPLQVVSTYGSFRCSIRIVGEDAVGTSSTGSLFEELARDMRQGWCYR
jgi:hypothetical protein